MISLECFSHLPDGSAFTPRELTIGFDTLGSISSYRALKRLSLSSYRKLFREVEICDFAVVLFSIYCFIGFLGGQPINLRMRLICYLQVETVTPPYLSHTYNTLFMVILQERGIHTLLQTILFYTIIIVYGTMEMEV